MFTKRTGFEPIYYSYKPYTLANVYVEQITAKYPNSLWIAAYPVTRCVQNHIGVSIQVWITRVGGSFLLVTAERWPR